MHHGHSGYVGFHMGFGTCDLRKCGKLIRVCFHFLRDVVVDLNGKRLRVLCVSDVLYTWSCIVEDLKTDPMALGEVESNWSDVVDLCGVLVCVGCEHARPPFRLLVQSGQREGFFEGDFAEHCGCLVK